VHKSEERRKKKRKGFGLFLWGKKRHGGSKGGGKEENAAHFPWTRDQQRRDGGKTPRGRGGEGGPFGTRRNFFSLG